MRPTSRFAEPLQSACLAQRHLLLNIGDFVHRRVPSGWRDALAGWPAVICDAGASRALDAALPELAPVAARTIVFGTDGALQALARHDVAVDFAVATSVLAEPEGQLAPDARPPRIVLSPLASPRWRELFASDRRYFLSPEHPTLAWLAEQGVEAAAVGATRGACMAAVELASFLGCAPIHLFGFGREPVRADGGMSLSSIPGYGDGLPHASILVTDREPVSGPAPVLHPRHFARTIPPRPGKRLALGLLPAPRVDDGPSIAAGFSAIGAQGARGCRMVDGLRALLEQGGASSVQRELRRLCADRDFAGTLGGFAAAMVDGGHCPPELDLAAWHSVLDQFEELCCLAEAVYGEAAV